MNKHKRNKKLEKLLHSLGWWGMLAVVLVLAYFLGGRLQPGQQRYMFFSPDHYPPGTIQHQALPLKKGSGMYIVNDRNNFYAVISADPYDGCSIQWSKMRQVFLSPCSDHRYAVDGSRLSGSSPGGLDRYPTKIYHGNLVIDTENRISGAPKPTAASNK